MQSEWLFIGVFLVLAPVFGAAALIIARLIAPRKPNPLKSETYECGVETVSTRLYFWYSMSSWFSSIPGRWHLIFCPCSLSLRVCCLFSF
jgi:hypothetical protein